MDRSALCRVMGRAELATDDRFVSLAARLQNQAGLDPQVAPWTRTQEPSGAMQSLQAAGVPAGVCQTAEDRVEHDPQLRHLEWLTEVIGTKIGRGRSPRCR